MKVRKLLLIVAGAAVVLSWSAVAIAYFFFDPSIVVWTALVTAAAISLEVFFWTAAGVLGWSFLAGRRAALQRLKQRFFGARGAAE